VGKLSEGKPTAYEAMERQTEFDQGTKTYTAYCSICGKKISLKKGLFLLHSNTIHKISQNFDYCRTCGRWVCEDCFFIDDGNGNGIGMCSACAKEQGIPGLTAIQFEEAWPQLQKRRQTRIAAVKRAKESQKASKMKKNEEKTSYKV